MPATPEGKAVASRSALADPEGAVTHGLHAQEVVLPHLGESQEEFNALLDGLTRELSPCTAVHEHYVTQIAQAMWRLRRLTRWETHLYDSPELTDEERIGKMARVLRHDAALRRHIDRALKALADTPAKQNCQNEPTILPNPPASGGPCDRGTREQGGGLPRVGALRKAQKLKQQRKCQNEPAPASTPYPPDPPISGGPCDRGTREQGGGPLTPPELGAGGEIFRYNKPQ